jgi:hypothetical protein
MTPRNAGDEQLDMILDLTFVNIPDHHLKQHLREKAKAAIQAYTARQVREALEKVDRFEVIDDTGRAYVKGSIYGTPVKVELSYQDDGRTLKVFVSPREAITDSGTVASKGGE